MNSLRHRVTDSCAWQDASVVALQIHGVSEPTRSSLQEYLLDVLDREACDIQNRRLLAQWTADSVEDAVRRVDQTMIIAH